MIGISDSHWQEIKSTAKQLTNFYALPLKQHTWRNQNHVGSLQGTETGSSIDFHDHRNYMPGDDPRHINWSAYARTGNYSMKLYRSEVQPVMDILFDASKSSYINTEKTTRCLELLFFSAFSALRADTNARVFLIGNSDVKITDCNQFNQLNISEFVKIILEINNDKNQPAPQLYSHKISLKKNAFRILISDLLFPYNYESYLKQISASNSRCIVFAPFLKTDAEPNWQARQEFIDIETDKKISLKVTINLLTKYKTSYQNHFKIWQESAQKHQALFARVPCGVSLNHCMQTIAQDSSAVIYQN